ncbi:DUF6069 family protein [Acidipropionibacterium virtanenii]|uniref:Uncharacterized protein n=1 Tax=Acidipropionibacterium virtanenii TaxID=2057246 RepID=A0A344UV20_9ACTN|nr:DUF6069 family protein [Acidipropionibacterium virtanenii]AXE39118.1 hypothetical protein JS278_01962 [Acidipropionibacterium virtanenii]
MTTQTDALDRNVPRVSAGRTSLVLTAAVIVAAAVNAVVARLATAGGATPGFSPLTLPVFGAFTLVGILAGWAGWRIIQHRSRRPERLLRWLVPVVGVLSFIPDVALGTLGFIPGANWSGVLGLMAMHVVVILVAVPAYLIAGRSRTNAA